LPEGNCCMSKQQRWCFSCLKHSKWVLHGFATRKKEIYATNMLPEEICKCMKVVLNQLPGVPQ
jgi:hypothetical protein